MYPDNEITIAYGDLDREAMDRKNLGMSTVALRQEAKALIDTLSEAQLRVASEFFAFVKAREADAATLELLAIPGFEESFVRGMKDIKAGRYQAMAQGAIRCISSISCTKRGI